MTVLSESELVAELRELPLVRAEDVEDVVEVMTGKEQGYSSSSPSGYTAKR